MTTNDEVTTEEFLVNMKQFFEGIDKVKTNLEQEISKVELERNDLLHELELAKLNAVEMSQLAKNLREVLQKRRIYKDELIRVMTIKGFTDKYNNKFIVGDIIQVLKNLRTLEKNNETRKYTPRIITNLKCVEAKDEQVQK